MKRALFRSILALSLLWPAFAPAQTLQSPGSSAGQFITTGYLYQQKMHYAGAWPASVERRISFQT